MQAQFVVIAIGAIIKWVVIGIIALLAIILLMWLINKYFPKKSGTSSSSYVGTSPPYYPPPWLEEWLTPRSALCPHCVGVPIKGFSRMPTSPEVWT